MTSCGTSYGGDSSARSHYSKTKQNFLMTVILNESKQIDAELNPTQWEFDIAKNFAVALGGDMVYKTSTRSSCAYTVSVIPIIDRNNPEQ